MRPRVKAARLVALLALCAGTRGCNWIWKLDRCNDPAHGEPRCASGEQCIKGWCVPVDGGLDRSIALDSSPDRDGPALGQDGPRRDAIVSGDGGANCKLPFTEGFIKADALAGWDDCADANHCSFSSWARLPDGYQDEGALQGGSPGTLMPMYLYHSFDQEYAFVRSASFAIAIRLAGTSTYEEGALHIVKRNKDGTYATLLKLDLSEKEARPYAKLEFVDSVLGAPSSEGGFTSSADLSQWYVLKLTITRDPPPCNDRYVLDVGGKTVADVCVESPLPAVAGVIVESRWALNAFDDIQVCMD